MKIKTIIIIIITLRERDKIVVRMNSVITFRLSINKQHKMCNTRNSQKPVTGR